MFSELKFPKEIAKDIATQEKEKRKLRKLTQEELSDRAGISLASLRRFEQTGEISFVSLIKIADILGEKDAFTKLFTSREYGSIQEVIDERNQSSCGQVSWQNRGTACGDKTGICGISIRQGCQHPKHEK